MFTAIIILSLVILFYNIRVLVIRIKNYKETKEILEKIQSLKNQIKDIEEREECFKPIR